MLREMTPYELLRHDIEHPVAECLRPRAKKRFEFYRNLARQYNLSFNEAYYMHNHPQYLRPRAWKNLERGGHFDKIRELEKVIEEQEVYAEYQFETARGN